MASEGEDQKSLQVLAILKSCCFINIITSRLPSQVMPSPVNPFLHEQMYEPSVLLQLALSPHEPGSVRHSSKSKVVDKKYTFSDLFILK